MRGLSNLIVTLLLLSIVVPASTLLISKVREYAGIVENQAGSLNQPVTLVAYLLRNNDQNILVVCNYGFRTLKDIYVLDSSGNRTQVIDFLTPKTCYSTNLSLKNWNSVTVGNQVVGIMKIS